MQLSNYTVYNILLLHQNKKEMPHLSFLEAHLNLYFRDEASAGRIIALAGHSALAVCGPRLTFHLDFLLQAMQGVSHSH